MKVVILAGGYGTRISEESMYKPKPMIEIGGIPILIHIMRYFYKNGFDDFVICAGYRSQYIKEFFMNYQILNSDVTFDLRDGYETKILKKNSEKWRVTIIDSGLDAQTGFRVNSVKDYIDDDGFILTYGDGLSDVNLKELIEQHNKDKTIATLTSVHLSGRFGGLNINENNKITEFSEKSKEDGSWINGGFMVLNKEVFDYIPNKIDCSFEYDVLPVLAKNGELSTYKHYGFWKCMDTLKDKNDFEEIWKKGNAPWK